MRYPEAESSFLEFKRDVPKNDQIIKYFTVVLYVYRDRCVTFFREL
jgi:hypothetical protein